MIRVDYRDEFLDRVFLASDGFDRYVLAHAQVVGEAETLLLANEISEKLGRLYQLAGALRDTPLKDLRQNAQEHAFETLLMHWPQGKWIGVPEFVNWIFEFYVENPQIWSAVRTLTSTFDDDAKPEASKLGKVFRKYRGKVISGRMLERSTANLWTVVEVVSS